MKARKSIPVVAALVASLWLPSMAAPSTPPISDVAPVRTKAERDALTPDQVLKRFRTGNERFVAGTMTNRDLLMEKQQTTGGQHPSAVVLSCMDSRAPAEFLFDKGIGEIFNARVAGNVLNPDLTGSLEFGCAVAGAKLIVVLGHTDCGAVKGAIDDVEMGSLTGLLERIHPAVVVAQKANTGDSGSSNGAFVQAVSDHHVELTVQQLRRVSPILRDLEDKGEIKIVGGMYDLSTGRVNLYEIAPES